MLKSEIEKYFPRQIFARIIVVQSLLILTGLAGAGLVGRYYFKKQFTRQVENQLHETLRSFSRQLALDPKWCSRFSDVNGLRLTLIQMDGKVICDTHHSAESMENHAERPEIREAMGGIGSGESIRHSTTLQEDMLYAAMKSDHPPAILRGAIPLANLSRTLQAFDQSFAVFLFACAFCLLLFATWSGRRLISPMGRLLAKMERISKAQGHELDGKIEGDGARESFGEWSQLESSIETIQHQLREKVESLDIERELQAALMASISDAILAIDKEGSALFFNSRFALLAGDLGAKKRSRVWDLFRESEILDAFRNALNEGKATFLQAVPITLPSGKRFYSISIAPLRKGQEQPFGAVGSFHDVTDLKRAEQIRIDFVANVSHELRTPLTSIKGYSETVLQDMHDGRSLDPHFVEIIARNADRLLNLINDLLDLSTLESSDIVRKEALSTGVVTNRVIQQMKDAFEKKHQTVKLDTNVNTVLADQRRLEQVLVNLLSNANKYTPEGGKITVSWSARDNVLLSVSDTGPGIPVEHHSRLFERFYRVDKGRSRDQGGTGLGLAIVKHIMQGHGGSVRVQSEMGKGTEFICEFPNS